MEDFESGHFLKDFIVQTVKYFSEKLKRNLTLVAEQEEMVGKIISELEKSVELGDERAFRLAEKKLETFFAALIKQETVFLLKLLEITEAYETSVSCAEVMFKENFNEGLLLPETKPGNISRNLDDFARLIIDFESSLERLTTQIRTLKDTLKKNPRKNNSMFKEQSRKSFKRVPVNV